MTGSHCSGVKRKKALFSKHPTKSDESQVAVQPLEKLVGKKEKSGKCQGLSCLMSAGWLREIMTSAWKEWKGVKLEW